MNRTYTRINIPPTSRKGLSSSLWGLASLAMAITGCAGQPTINVEKQWEDSMRNLNMFALYPLTEDVQIGDIFLYAPENGGSGGRQFRLTRIDTMGPRGCTVEALTAQQGTRLRIEPTVATPAPADPPKAKAVAPASTILPEPCLLQPDMPAGRVAKPAATAGAIFDVGNPQNLAAPIRMRRSAVPAFTAATITNGQLSGAGIFGQIGAAFGLSASQDVAVAVTLKDIEEISVDAGAALRLEEDQGARFLGNAGLPEAILAYVEQARPDLAEAFCHAEFEAFATADVYFIIANRVMYVHGIEYGYQNNRQLDLAIQASIAAPGVAAALPSAPAAPAAPPAAAALPANTMDAIAQARTSAAANRAALDAGTPQSPGGKASFGIGRFGSSSLNVTFDQPLAVGIGTPITLPVGEMIRLSYMVATGKHPLPRIAAPEDRPFYDRMMIKYAQVRPAISQSFENVAAICAGKYHVGKWNENLTAFLARKPASTRPNRPGL